LISIQAAIPGRAVIPTASKRNGEGPIASAMGTRIRKLFGRTRKATAKQAPAAQAQAGRSRLFHAASTAAAAQAVAGTSLIAQSEV
jgi:hypothetical protein